jgi:hypothetical protein
MVAWSDDVAAAWELHAAELTQLPGVTMVATGRRVRDGRQTREQVVVVTVTRKLSPDQLTTSTMVPRELRLPDGSVVGTDVVEDPATVFTPDQDSASYRPVPGGCEIAPFGSAFLGTLGGWFCAPEAASDSGWGPVWLTNAHVAAPVDFATIPADPRVRQPAAGGVIGSTTAISGWPTPLPGPGVTVAGVTDAAVGRLDDDVTADYQVLDIGPAPFEIGAVTAGMQVQKRGRTTLLRTGTVMTQPGGGPFLAANVGSPAGGAVTFGLPGQPPLFRVTSPGTGLGAAFGMPGDSGSLVFGIEPGQLQTTVPCVGLYFAGTGNWVSQQPNPNDHTVTGLAFDIAAVMALMNLETVCTCMVRSLLAAIFGRTTDRVAGDATPQLTRRAERMMRRFRDAVLVRSTVGRTIAEAVAQTAPDVSRVLATDPVAFGLAVDLLEPWARASTSLTVLQRSVDERTVAVGVELAERVTRLAPETAEQITPMVELLRKHQGEPVRRLIGTFRPAPPSKREGTDRREG